MHYGICNLSIVPIRATPSDNSEMVNQMLFGETFTVLEKERNWYKIALTFDNYEGYIDSKQCLLVSNDSYHKILSSKTYYTADIVEYISNKNQLITILLGSNLPLFSNYKILLDSDSYSFEGNFFSEKLDKKEISRKAFTYLNSPFLWGGKTPFGIDCSGFTQMVYKLCGYTLLRDVKQQATQGEVLSFIEESEPGDLAFFDNEEGEIIHVGIILMDYHIIHSYGKVRIDTLDHSGIFNKELQKHTHKLRVIKKII